MRTLVAILMCLMILATGAVYAQEVGAQSIIIDDVSDSFTIGYLFDMRGLDSVVVLGPSMWEVNNRIDFRPYGRVSTSNWFGSVLDELDISTNASDTPDYSVGATFDWAAVKYHDFYLNVYLGADYDLSTPFKFDSDDVELFPGVGITTPINF
jgi:hypothetical protein